MINIAATLGFAFLLGAQHAVEPDHMVAVTSLVAKHKKQRRAVRQGVIWGLGHTTTLFIVGLIVLLLKFTIPEKVAMSLEFAVGLVIIGLGMHLIVKLFTEKIHVHSHRHHGHNHTHFHSHKKHKHHKHEHTSFAVGLVHGMAGSAALMLLVLSTLQSTILGLGFILLFGLGSVLGMGVMSYLVSLPFTYTAKKHLMWNKGMKYVTGIFSIIFGIFILVKIGYLEGLLI